MSSNSFAFLTKSSRYTGYDKETLKIWAVIRLFTGDYSMRCVAVGLDRTEMLRIACENERTAVNKWRAEIELEPIPLDAKREDWDSATEPYLDRDDHEEFDVVDLPPKN